tara:strand:+ start:431 stop:874 length:444 start_codon:yes stop_codon:yes gene_type:complete
MKTIIHVNQHILKRNIKNCTSEPCIITRTYKEAKYNTHTDIISNGELCASVVQQGGSIRIKAGDQDIRVLGDRIRSNINRTRTLEPVLEVSQNKKLISRQYGFDIKDSKRNVVAQIIYNPYKPLSCGARLWIETQSENIECGEDHDK